MHLRKLGSSDLQVSEISLGSWLTYSGGVEREQARACVDAAFDAGINFIDTANVYGRGAAEEVLGEVLAERERSSYVLATKVYFPMSWRDKAIGKADPQADRRFAEAPAHGLRRPLSMSSLRRRRAAGGDDRRAERGRARRQGPPHRLQRVAVRAHRAVAGAARCRALGLQPAAVLDAVAKARGEVIPLCEREHISQIVWSRSGRAC